MPGCRHILDFPRALLRLCITIEYLKGRMRNILFILVDCLRADAIWGTQRRTVTPTIDRLMQRGTYFSQAISTTSTTTPCVASMLTGNYPFSHGIRSLSGYKLNSECVTHSPSIKKGRLSYLCYGHRSFVADNRTRPRVRRIRIPHEETYLSDGWGENLRRKFRQRELREPWFAFLHLWELHKPRKVAQGFDSKRFGSDLYERAVSSSGP